MMILEGLVSKLSSIQLAAWLLLVTVEARIDFHTDRSCVDDQISPALQSLSIKT